MKNFAKTLPPLFLAAMLASCSSVVATPTSPADIMKTAIPTATPIFLPALPLSTTTPMPTLILSASSTPLVFTDPSIPISERIVYYYFVTTGEIPIPEGSVLISSTYILAPTFSDLTYSPDTAADLRKALEAVLHDGRNSWISSNLKIVDVTFDDGRADVVLQGEYFGVGDVTLIAASMQILMTVFANTSVQTATVTLNGDTIGNLGVSNSMNARPTNYVFTRAEIETFMKEHAYVSP